MLRISICAATLVAGFGLTAYGQGRPQIILFQEDNFRGNQVAIDGSTPSLNPLHFNDRASSVRVISGNWRLCEHDDFRGRCVTVSRDESKLGRLGMDDAVSSLEPDDGRSGRRGRDDRRRDRDWNRR